jgi:hypothetical protein
MFQHFEDEELFLGPIPVGSDPFKNRGPIVEGIGHYGDFGFGRRHEFAVEINGIHSNPPCEVSKSDSEEFEARRKVSE